MRIFRVTSILFLVSLAVARFATPAWAQGTLPSLPPASSSAPEPLPAAPAPSTPSGPLPALPPSPPSSSAPIAPSAPSVPPASYAPGSGSFPPPPAPAGEGPPVREKKLSLGADLMLLVPVGTLADGTGVLPGLLLRVGYRVAPLLDLTLRAGFLFGLNKSQADAPSTSETVIPIWAGARYFLLAPRTGLYAVGEVGVNLLQVHLHTQSVATEASGVQLIRGRGGFNVGAGWVLSETLPIDLRVQFTYLNLLGTDSGDDPLLGVGLSVGYTFAF